MTFYDRKGQTGNKNWGDNNKLEKGTLMQVFPTRSFLSLILVKTWFQTFSTARQKNKLFYLKLVQLLIVSSVKKSFQFQMTSLKYAMFLSKTAFVYRGLSVTPTLHWALKLPTDFLPYTENSEITRLHWIFLEGDFQRCMLPWLYHCQDRSSHTLQAEEQGHQLFKRIIKLVSCFCFY